MYLDIDDYSEEYDMIDGSSEGKFLIDFINMRISLLKYDLKSKKYNSKLMRKISISIWALETLIEDIYSSNLYITMSIIRAVLENTIIEYREYYNKNTKEQMRFLYAEEALESIYEMIPTELPYNI